MGARWTEEEIAVFRKQYPILPWGELYSLFPERTHQSLLKQAQKLSLKRIYPRDIDRFLSQVDRTDDCWIWTGTLLHNGYGQFGVDGGYVLAHRWSYEYFNGIIPDGHDCHHRCYNRSCVNPNHLTPLTNKDNVLDGNGPTAINARKTHCIRGHQLDGYNLVVSKDGNRRCRQCIKDGKRRRRAQGCGY